MMRPGLFFSLSGAGDLELDSLEAGLPTQTWRCCFSWCRAQAGKKERSSGGISDVSAIRNHPRHCVNIEVNALIIQ